MKTAIGFLAFAIVWVVTWVFPLSFMIAMAWGCDSSARALGRRALIFYDSEPDSAQAAIAAAKQRKDPGQNKRQILRTTLLVLSFAIPIAFIAFVDQERQRTGITPLTARRRPRRALTRDRHRRHRHPPLDPGVEMTARSSGACAADAPRPRAMVGLRERFCQRPVLAVILPDLTAAARS